MDYRTTPWPKCKHPPCMNPGRYTSGFCGIHDLLLNDARGEKVERSIPRCSHCSVEIHDHYYADVPMIGISPRDLCIPCWKKEKPQ